MENQKISLDEVLDKFSIFGTYHLQFMLFAMLTYLNNAMSANNYIFAAEESQYRCIDDIFSNNTCGSENGKWCSEWIYDNPQSFVAEFQLACKEWKRTLVGTANSFGYMVGLLIVGPLSDRIGRKKTLICTGVIGAVLGVAKSFSHSYWLYVALEVLGAVLGDNYSPLYVLNVEVVSAKKRVIFHFLCGLGSVVGGVLYSLSAWEFPYWRNLIQVTYAPGFFFIVYVLLIDESPRWLLTKGKKEEAIAIVKKMSHKNRISIEKDVFDKLLVDNKDKIIDLVSLLKITFQSRTLLKRCLVCIVWWTTSTFVNYGLVINSVSLKGNKYVNFALLQLVDLPGSFIIMYVLHNYKRRNPLICSFFGAALLCFIQPFLPNGLPWLSVTVYMVSMLMSSFYFSITYIYTSELFPTYTRNSMHAMCSSIGRIGSIIAPQTPLLMVYWSGLPMMVFGCASLVAGLVTFLVPDTADSSLPDTVQEAENIGNKNELTMTGLENLGMTEE